jgi:(1->4)-alpha-D-glucan 1-alpha-D-glucosylmutase
MGRTSCRSARSINDRILGDAHPELERLGDAFAGLPNHRPNVVRRAKDFKGELAALAAERPDVVEAVLQAVASFNTNTDRLHGLIQRQHWRPAYFQVAADDINYRRFFNINELAGLPMEQPELFDLTHRFVLEKIGDGTLDGLRIDHIDGLLDPKGYCTRLRAKAARPFYLVVEKILACHEHLARTGRSRARPATSSRKSSADCSSIRPERRRSAVSIASSRGSVARSRTSCASARS